MAAKQCKHLFQGHKDGVTCMKCGLKMGVEEYLNYLNPKEEVQEETKEEVQEETKEEVQEETKEEVKEETKEEVKEETKEEVKEKPQRKPRTQKGAK